MLKMYLLKNQVKIIQLVIGKKVISINQIFASNVNFKTKITTKNATTITIYVSSIIIGKNEKVMAFIH